jgi:peptide/nickel transport system substrate-binding protein
MKFHRMGACAAFALLLAACTRVTQTSATASGANPWTIPGVVRISVNADVNSFDPVISRLYVENYIDEAIFSGLVKYDSHEELAPDLAVQVPSVANGGISEDGHTITYHLRRNAFWQDGVQVTSADVRFTYDLIMDPASGSPVLSTYAHIVSIDTPDPYTVVLHLRQPFAPLLSNIFCNGAFGEIVPQHVLAKSRDLKRDPFNTAPVGSGPYRLERWERGSTIVLAANPKYFGGAPHVREIDVVILPNENTQLVSMQGHALEVVTQARAAQLPSYRGIDGISVRLAPTQVEEYVSFNLQHAPLDDVRVRRALALALDRPRIAATAFVGTAIAADSMIPPYDWAYAQDNGAPRFDPAEANRLLDAAGWTMGAGGMRERGGQQLSIGLLYAPSPTSTVIADEIERAWHAVGVQVDLRSVLRNVQVGDIEPSGAFDAALDGVGFDADPDRSQFIESRFAEPNGFNDARYRDADVDAWSEAALRTYDPAVRARYYALIQRRLNRDLPFVPIAWERFAYAVNTDLHGLEPETINSDFWNVQDWKI